MVVKKETKDNKQKEIIEKNDIVTISYKLYDSQGNLIDESPEDHPLILQYGKTVINKILEKKLKGKKVHDEIEIKQKLKTKAPLIEITLDDLDDEKFHDYKEGELIELNVTGKPSLFVVEKFDMQTGRLFVRHKNPFEGTTLTNVITVEKIVKNKK
jgi:FKBP-type peptidyl-prolyl cis-trans isomerase 2